MYVRRSSRVRQTGSASRGWRRASKRNTVGKLALAALASASLGACGQTSGRIVVHGGVGIITEGELKHWETVLAAVARPKPGEKTQIRDEALDFLIKARWVERAARGDHIVVGKMEGNELLSLVMHAHSWGLPAVHFGWEDELKRYLASPVASLADQLWIMNLSLFHTKLERRALEHADSMLARTRVVRYYLDHRRRFVVPEHRDVAIVEASSLAAMRNARRALIAGVPPRVVAKHFSEGPYDAIGLKLHYAKSTGNTLDRAIFSAVPHLVVGPLRSYWYYVFEVLRVEPRRQQGLIAVEGEIRRTLAKQGLSGKLDSTLAKRWSPLTACQPGYIVAGCR